MTSQDADSLATGLLHAPEESREDPRLRWAYRGVWLWVGSLFAAYFALVLLIHNLPSKGLTRPLHKTVNKYLQARNFFVTAGMTQSWGMFAPNPHRSNMFMRVLVKDQDGEVWDLKHDIYNRRRYPYLFYDRMGKINRRIISQEGYRRHYAAWVCRDWERKNGVLPEEVTFVKTWTRIPKPRIKQKWPPVVFAHDPAKLKLHQEEQDTFKCSITRHAQLPKFMRERLGMPVEEAARFHDFTIRTWAVKKKQAEKAERRKAEQAAKKAKAGATSSRVEAPAKEAAK